MNQLGKLVVVDKKNYIFTISSYKKNILALAISSGMYSITDVDGWTLWYKLRASTDITKNKGTFAMGLLIVEDKYK